MKVTKRCTVNERNVYMTTAYTSTWTGAQTCTRNNGHTQQIPSGTITAHSTRAWGMILWNKKRFVSQISWLVSTDFKERCAFADLPGSGSCALFWTTNAPAEGLWSIITNIMMNFKQLICLIFSANKFIVTSVPQKSQWAIGLCFFCIPGVGTRANLRWRSLNWLFCLHLYII